VLTAVLFTMKRFISKTKTAFFVITSVVNPHKDPDSTYHPDAEPDADPDSNFYLIRIRIFI
jgi:hypothetical protein